jgi:hypothetical protein
MKYALLHGLLCLAALCGCGGNRPPEQALQEQKAPDQVIQEVKPPERTIKTDDTLEAMFHGFVDSVNKKDWSGFLGCMTGESQEMVVGSLALIANMMASMDAKQGGEIEAVLKKHNAKVETASDPKWKDPKFAMKAMNDRIKDKPAFLGELIDVMDKQNPGKKKIFGRFDGIIGDVKKDGDSATARITTTDEKGKETEDKIHFKKENGGWKIDLVASMGGK